MSELRFSPEQDRQIRKALRRAARRIAFRLFCRMPLVYLAGYFRYKFVEKS